MSPSVVVGVVAPVVDVTDDGDDGGVPNGWFCASQVDCVVDVPSESGCRGRFRSCRANSITSSGMLSPVCMTEGGGF